MARNLLVAVLVLVANSVWGQDWGGTDYRDPDSMDATYIAGASGSELKNFGSSTTMSVKFEPDSSCILLRIKNDPHTDGATQDSMRWFLEYVSGYPNPGESLRVDFHVLKIDWGEGDNTGTTADAGEASYDSAKTGTIDWNTDGGFGVGTDYNAAIAGSLYVVYGMADSSLSFHVAGEHLTAEFFAYGLIGIPKWRGEDDYFGNCRFGTDNNATVTSRPYPLGYESASGTSYGANAFGAKTVGAQ